MNRTPRLGVWASVLYRPSVTRWRRHPLLAELRRLEDEQWLAPENAIARHTSRLDDLIGFALARVPYYRRRLRQVGLAGAALRLPADLVALPVLTRDELIACRDELVPRVPALAGTRLVPAGGPDGPPVSLLREEACRIAVRAATLRQDRWAGWDFGTRTVVLRDGGGRPPVGSRRRPATRWLERRRVLDAPGVDRQRWDEAIDRIRAFRPGFLKAPAGELERLAYLVGETGRGLPSLRGIACTTGPLDEDVRQRVRDALGAPVFDHHRCPEVGPVAAQCAEGRYHVNTRGAWVEILDPRDRPAAPGMLGRVVVTALAQRAMPLLRYETGDVAEAPSASSCPCGRTLPLSGPVRGRLAGHARPGPAAAAGVRPPRPRISRAGGVR